MLAMQNMHYCLRDQADARSVLLLARHATHLPRNAQAARAQRPTSDWITPTRINVHANRDTSMTAQASLARFVLRLVLIA